ncbi:hypothetical protein NFI96_011592 [Prochilodus magdalenae]|nr:hypothetical protein NFI96_011592 [Prochilodus magdalenae]
MSVSLSIRVLRPPGGGSNISFGAEEDKPAARKDKMASNIFAEPEDPHAHRRNNPPGGKPTGVLCGEPSAPLRRCATQPANQNDALDEPSANGENNTVNAGKEKNALYVSTCPSSVDTGRCPTGRCPTGRCLHRTLPPQDAASTGRCPTGRCPTGRCPTGR